MSLASKQVGHLLKNRKVFAWAMYDWANIFYTTLMITVRCRVLISRQTQSA